MKHKFSTGNYLLAAFCFTLFATTACRNTLSSTTGSTMNTPTKAPDFTLQDQDGNTFHLAEQIGKKKMVIFFYPKDESLVCTKEACAFRDSFEVFKEAGAMVIGISADSVESHKSFQQNHRLPYTLLSDPSNKTLRAFGVKNVLFLTGRETFVVDLSGNIVFRFRGMLSGGAHVQETLQYLKDSR